MSHLCRLPFYILFFLLIFKTQAFDNIPKEDASKVDSKVKFSFGYDNNVSEKIENRTKSRFYQLYLNSGMYALPTEKTLVSLRLQDGFKYLDSSSLSSESVLINNLSLYMSHRVLNWLIPEVQSEIMGRTSIHGESDVLPSEEAFLRGAIGLALKAMFYDDITCRAFYHYRFTNFEDFDPFDRRGPTIGLKADVRLLPGSTAGIQYTRENNQYNKWDILDSVIKRSDKLDDLSIFAQFYKYFLFDITYSHQSNKSDINGYSYRSNKLALLMARTFQWDIMLQVHGHIRSRKYISEPNEPDETQMELEDDEREMLTAKISKEISQYCGLGAQYDFRRSKSSEGNAFYTKSVFSLSLSFQF